MAGRNDLPRVLCVDDEPQVLEGLKLHLRKSYRVHTAEGGAAGLEELAKHKDFAVVLSDMRMPEMDGAAFLHHVKDRAPNSVRMLLTGETQIVAAASAINDGQIFRFLIKPCKPDKLLKAFSDAVEQHELLCMEKVLLQKTLLGSIKALLDVLALTSPKAFGRANRVKLYANELAKALEIKNRWQVEIAAMLSQIGSITLPPETIEKLYHGYDLNAKEKEQVRSMPEVACQLLGNIPRLEAMLDIIKYTPAFDSQSDHDLNSMPEGARLLHIVSDYEALQTASQSTQLALDTMRSRENRYDQYMLQVFSDLRGVSEQHSRIVEVPPNMLKEGMILAEELRTTDGTLLMTLGYEVNASLLTKIHNHPQKFGSRPIKVTLKNTPDDKLAC
ncbi:MAG: response regulator [Gammaproteobacteria bacterium]|nr:response regulator [Gammaproteobacteria bacterium]